ncbi:helix-turn-helix domain-containing protein [Kribbella sp. NPDC056861]|uniref:helix-turn-helix domain-containing protein n=1 Tax=Kribbella sp. NPDC056861 TaxID=3154857 RepID=UPI00341CE8B5
MDRDTSTIPPEQRANDGLPLDGSSLLLTVTEASDALRISRWALYQLINKRRLKTVQIGRRRLVPTEDLIAFVADLRSEGGGHGL